MDDSIAPFTRLRSRVCIGMPLRNAERFVAHAIESILSQTFSDLELVISDNASTDATAEICQSYARRDSRITYCRLEQPISDAENRRRVYQLSAGQYFKWAWPEDAIEPEFIGKCVEALDAVPAAVLACPRAALVDRAGRPMNALEIRLATDSSHPHLRFAAIVTNDDRRAYVPEFFGLMRRSAMDLIPPQGDHPGSDRVFLSRLALCGRFIEIPQRLLILRDRAIEPRRIPGTMTFPEWRIMFEYLTSVRYGWLNTGIRIHCVSSVLRRELNYGNWVNLLRDVAGAAQSLFTRNAPVAADPIEPALPVHRPLPFRPKAAA